MILEGYKETKVGIIPQDWIVHRLDDLVKVTDGTHRTPTYTTSGVPFLRVTDIAGPDIDLTKVKYISRDEHNELTKRCKPEKGDILYSKNGTIGIPRVVTWDWEFSTFVSLALLKVKDKDQVDVDFLSLYLASELAKKEIYRSSKQGTVTNLHLEEIRKFGVPLPPLPEQRKVAETLSVWDQAIALAERRIEAARQRKKGLMQRLLTGRVRFPEFEEEEWREAHLRSIATINPSKPKHLFDDTLVSFIAMADVSEDAQITSASERPYREVSTGYTSFQDNDVIVAKITPCLENGKGALIKGLKNGVGFGSTEFHVIRANDTKILPEFLYFHTIAHDFRGRGEANMAGSAGQKRIRTDFLKAYKILLPPIKEQRRIAAILQTCDREIELLTQKRDALQRQKKGLMQRLLTGRVRVSPPSNSPQGGENQPHRVENHLPPSGGD